MKKKVKRNKKNSNNKKIILAFVFLIVGYFIYKGINLMIYDIHSNYFGGVSSDYEDIYKNFENEENVFIINQVKTNNNDYLKYKDMKVKDVFKEFKKVEDYDENMISYRLEDNDYKDGVKASFSMGVSKSYVDMFIEGIDDIGKFRNISIDDRKRIIKENKIENDLDFIRFIKKYKNVKNNIFTSVKKMKENFYVAYFINYNFYKSNDFRFIDGDYVGFMTNNIDNDNKYEPRLVEVIIFKNNKRYFLIFSGRNGYFNDDNIKEILNSLVID